MAIIDLSHPLVTGMPVYPGGPGVRITPALELGEHGGAVSRLDLGSHAGTHLDAPSHSIAGGRTVDEIPLGLLVGPALILRASGTARARIEEGDLGLPDRLPGIVCIATGWDRRFGTDEMLRHPSLSLSLVEALWERGARVLGVDALSPDATDGGDGTLPVHEFWLGRDGVIVENLRGLEFLPDEVEMSLLPLRVDGGDGSPVRAIAFVP